MGKSILGQLQQLLIRLTPRQRMIAGGGIVLSLLALAAMVKTFGTPEYKPLMTGLEPADAQAMGAELAAKKIDYQLSTDGKGINVAADQIDAARMEIASEGPVHSGRMGFELFDKTSWGQTEFDEKVNYQRALEGELERTIATLSGVKSARVHLVLPTPSVFLDRERGAKASVALRMKHGSLPDDQLRAIARLVSGAVDDLKPGDVTILDADTNETLGSRGGTAEGHEMEAELTQRLLATLGPAVGAENLRASVNVQFDPSSSEESQDRYDPAVSVVLNSQKTREQTGAGTTAAGVAGTSANLPVNTPGAANPQDPSLADDGSQMSSSENSSFGVNKTVRRIVTPAGRIQRLTAAILVNDLQDHKLVKGKWVSIPRKPTPAQLQQLQQLAQSVLGADPQRGDVVTVQNMSFSSDASGDVPPSFSDRVRSGLTEYASLVRYGALLALFLLVWALMLRPIQKQVLATMKELKSVDPQPALAARSVTQAELGTNRAAALPAAETETEIVAAKRKISELIQAEPAAMTRTLQAWLREDTA
jgi:flagellar M-ring protein FliF